MGIRKAKAQEQAKAAEAQEAKEPQQPATFFAAADKPAEQQQYLAPNGEITTDPGLDNRPEDRPRINQRTLRTFFDGAQPGFEFSTHRARRESTPHAQAQRAAAISAEREKQEARSRFGIDWLMNLLTK